MCIYLHHTFDAKISKAKRSKHNITVIKRVYKSLNQNDRYGYSNTEFKSFFQSFIYEIGYHYSNDNFPLSTKKDELEGEGIHSWVLKDMHSTFLNYNRIANSQAYLKCVIPAGTPYYTGGIGSEIISKELIIVKVLDREEINSITKLKREQERKARLLREARRKKVEKAKKEAWKLKLERRMKSKK